MRKLICVILICCIFILGVIKVIQMIKNKQNSTYSIVLFSISLITVTTVFLLIVDRLNGGNRIDYFSEQNLIKSLGTIDMSWRDNSTQTPKASMPKIIHRTYKNFPEAMKLFKIPWEETSKNLPDWNQKFWADSDIESWLLNTFGQHSGITKAYHAINPKFGAARADLFRYLICYMEGGLYLDIKSTGNKPPSTLTKNTEMMVSHWKHPQWPELFGKLGEIQNWFIYSLPGAKPLEYVIQKIVQNIRSIQLHDEDAPCLKLAREFICYLPRPKRKVLSTTGPWVYSFVLKNFIDNNDDRVKVVKPDLDNYVSYGSSVHKLEQRDDHYSKQKGKLILTSSQKISEDDVKNAISELRSAFSHNKNGNFLL